MTSKHFSKQQGKSSATGCCRRGVLALVFLLGSSWASAQLSSWGSGLYQQSKRPTIATVAMARHTECVKPNVFAKAIASIQSHLKQGSAKRISVAAASGLSLAVMLQIGLDLSNEVSSWALYLSDQVLVVTTWMTDHIHLALRLLFP